MQTLILTLHIVVCTSLIVLVLLQAGKEGMGVIFGGGSGSVFGSGGAGGMLSKLTAFMAVLFILTSLSYNVVTSKPASEKSVILDGRLEDSAPTPPASSGSAPAVDPLDKAGSPVK